MRFVPDRHRPLLAVVALSALSLAAFRTFPGNPFWPRNGAGQNYVANLHPSRFLTNGAWDRGAQRALQDWASSGGTSFAYGVTRIAADSNNHGDGVNTWDHVNQGQNGVLAVTYVRWSGNQLVDCDMQFNLAYTWTTTDLEDPNEDLNNVAGFDIRAVARHETGHAIGLDHEDALLDCMNSIYTVGAGVQHRLQRLLGGQFVNVYGMLPHADDKFGGRILYPPGVPTTSVNLMCTSWREPVPGTGQARKLSLASSSYAAGSPLRVPVYYENQSNVSVAGGPSGVHTAVYLSTDKSIDPVLDTLLRDYTFQSNFGPHAFSYQELDTAIPANTPSGTYFVGVVFDNTNLVSETLEGDNFAWYGPITVNNLPDLVITTWTPVPSNPVRGATFTINLEVRNIGFAPSVPSAVHIYVQPTSGTSSPVYHFLGAPNVPAIGPGGSYTTPYVTTMPPDICGGMNFVLRGNVDLGGWNTELDENNNFAEATVTPQWPAASGFYLGSQQVYIDGFTSTFAGRLCSKAQGVSLTPTTWYFMLWTCSGTSPGIALPPFGVLPLNYDVCTQIGQQLEGVYFAGSRGVQRNLAAGELMSVQSGTWLTPLRGVITHFASVYVDVASGQLVGVSRNAVPVGVR